MGEERPRAVEAVRAVSRLSKLFERQAGELGLAHYRVLAAVAAGDERASRVAARLTMGKPAVSAAVATLCHRGWLERSESADDQRVTHLALTSDGRVLLGEVEGRMVGALVRLAARTEHPEAVVDGLVALGAALDEALAEHGR